MRVLAAVQWRRPASAYCGDPLPAAPPRSRSPRPGSAALAIAAVLLSAALVVAGCGSPRGGAAPDVVVGAGAETESALLAAVYVAALRAYGFGARTDASAGQIADPIADQMAKLDSGAFTVVPAFTGWTLQLLQPGDATLSDASVYKAMIAALPEGVAAGDYTTAAEDKPALAVTQATADAWGGAADLSALPKHCDPLTVGIVRGAHAPSAVGSCRLPTPRELPDSTTLFAAVRAGQLTAGWTTTASPDVPGDLVVLNDGKSALVRAENVVPLYRRNSLGTRQLLALNEIAGVLDTAALADMRRQVAAGADPQAVAGGWLAEHPLGR